MKKIFSCLFLLVSITVSAQKDVTKFLGIPVDGYKTEMKKKLISKGFTYNSQNDFFEGEFNGQNVNVYIATNNNKVWRIMVCDANTCSETDIKIRFNKQCGQFEKNPKYIAANLGKKEYTISCDEEISYEMSVHKKRYEASYLQIPDPELIDTLAIQQKVKNILLQEYTKEQIENPNEQLKEDMQNIAQNAAYRMALDIMEKKFVWFMISENYGRFYITMFYDNEYNHANGEDL
jgi:hypothetical protein